MITIKLPYTSSNDMKENLLLCRKQYSSVLRWAFNRYEDGMTQKSIRQLSKTLSNTQLLDSWYIQCAIMEAETLYKSKIARKNTSKFIFGGKLNFHKRNSNKISKEEFQRKRLSRFAVLGESLAYGNRKFKLQIIEDNKLVWKYKKGVTFNIYLPKLRKNYKKLLFNLQSNAERKLQPYMISLDDEYVYFTFEELLENKTEFKSSGVHAGIDLNPNYISCSIKDENQTLLYSVTYDLHELTKKNCNQNKLNFETIEISKNLCNILKQHNVSFLFIEDLNIKSKNNGKGKSFNRLVNNSWKRNLFINNLRKRCNLLGINLFEVNPAYSSLIGNMLYDTIPDPICASIEIARRGYECIILKNKQFLPDFISSISLLSCQWKDVIIENDIKSWKELFAHIKNSRLKYRVSLDDDTSSNVFRKFCSHKSGISRFIESYDFI